MTTTLPADLDFLVARLHGRRSRLAEAELLDELSRLRTIPDLIRAVCPDREVHSAVELQAWLIRQTVEELGEFTAQLPGAGGSLMAWLRVRYQIENLKVMLRAFSTGRPFDVARRYLVRLPGDLALDLPALSAAESVESFAEAVPRDILRESLLEAAPVYEETPRPLVLEAALDRAYLGQLLTRTQALPRPDRGDPQAIARQETDTFHLMLVARGRFTYDLPAERLAAFHVRGSGISEGRLGRMLEARSLRRAAAEAVGLALDKSFWPDRDAGEAAMPADPAQLEAGAWNRYLRLARRGFRHSHMGLGAVVAFAALRRIELANLIRLSEGIRLEMESEAIRRRLIPTAREASDV